MDNNINVIAIVVTYNRKELLLECITALLNQSYKLKTIIIIDNASTDGTEEMLQEYGIMDNTRINYVKMESNTGGSGGFYTGLDIARKNKTSEWIWIMDDDTIPNSNSLEYLVEATKKVNGASFFSSCVKGPQGEPMNVPVLDLKPTENGYADWYMKLTESMVKIQKSTFVSVLINKSAVEKCGLPCRDYFIWGDDFEYTSRLVKNFGPAFLVGNSWVCHKRFNAKAISIEDETNSKRLEKYHYYYRNSLINSYVYEGKKSYAKFFLKMLISSFGLLPGEKGIKKFWTMQKGIFASIINLRKFNKYINEQISIKTGI